MDTHPAIVFVLSSPLLVQWLRRSGLHTHHYFAHFSLQLAKQIRRQVEFYFSDSNLPKDNFLKGLYDQNNGWVEITTSVRTFYLWPLPSR